MLRTPRGLATVTGIRIHFEPVDLCPRMPAWLSRAIAMDVAAQCSKVAALVWALSWVDDVPEEGVQRPPEEVTV